MTLEGYTTDEETVEQLRAWWRENGPWIIGGLALGAAVLFGWRYWTEWREQQLALASDTYAQVLAASEAGDVARAVELAAAIAGLRLPTPYEEMAALAVARAAVVAGDPAVARGQLRAAIDDGGREVALLARLRLARLELAAGEPQAAADALAVADPGRYRPLFDELRGDVALARGDRAAAVAAYRDAMAGAAGGIADRTMLQMKLDDLGAAGAGQGA